MVVAGADYATTVKVSLSVTPGTVGANSFVAQVTDYASGRAAAASGVQLEFSLPSHPSVGPSTLVLKQAADGTWRGSGLELSVAGDWTCDVVVQGARQRGGGGADHTRRSAVAAARCLRSQSGSALTHEPRYHGAL